MADYSITTLAIFFQHPIDFNSDGEVVEENAINNRSPNLQRQSTFWLFFQCHGAQLTHFPGCRQVPVDKTISSFVSRPSGGGFCPSEHMHLKPKAILVFPACVSPSGCFPAQGVAARGSDKSSDPMEQWTTTPGSRVALSGGKIRTGSPKYQHYGFPIRA